MYDFMKMIRNPEVVAFVRGDVNGDRIPDNVFVTGYKETDVSIIQNMALVIQDGTTGQYVNLPLEEGMGYDPGLFLGDFTGDGVNDIFLNIPSGGSGGTTNNYIYSFVNNVPRLLFDSNVFNQEYQYDVNYQDNYKVEVISHKNNIKYMIDLSLRPSDYLNEIYDENGKLKTPISGWVDPISGIYPIGYSSRNPIYQLLAYQQIAGTYHADTVGVVENRLKWNGNRFILDNQGVGIFGTEF